MTRKDFKMIAEVVSSIEDKHVRQATALNFAHRLKDTNPRFNATRFIDACDPID
jgi:hypothetical protein